ncbi:MAG: hypothetical protein ACI81V_000750 [Lentimonas sp.]|jgi:hypothetical protein
MNTQDLALLALILSTSGSLMAAPLVTDRPDATESSSVIAPNFFQLEVGVTSFEDSAGISGVESMGTLLRVGVIENLELRLGWGGYLESNPVTGANDAMLGIKYYLVAESGIRPEMALLLHTSLPVGDNALTSDAFDPDFLLSCSHTLSDRFSFGYNVGAQLESSQDESGHESTASSALYSAALGYSINERMGAFIELFGAAGFSSDESPASIDGGLTWLINDDMQLDCYAGVGLNGDADEWFFGLGYSIRWPFENN